MASARKRSSWQVSPGRPHERQLERSGQLDTPRRSGAGDTATVSAAGSYVVQLDVPAIGSLILDAPDATIDPVGSFALSGLLDLKAGSLSVNDTITGGTIRPRRYDHL